MTTMARILGFIPILVSLLAVVLLLIYKPEGYGVVVGVFAFIYLIVVPVMFLTIWPAVKRARKLRMTDLTIAVDDKKNATRGKMH